MLDTADAAPSSFIPEGNVTVFGLEICGVASISPDSKDLCLAIITSSTFTSGGGTMSSVSDESSWSDAVFS